MRVNPYSFNTALNVATIQQGRGSTNIGEISGTLSEQRRVVTCDIFRKRYYENKSANFNWHLAGQMLRGTGVKC